ncbi:MAG: DUF2358 domain-containing protein [Oscillatoria sp. PMC 1051.18]|nr:DUF2358 domain-containing protein [Oscillatoria sp. PMC 1050.18]MEC5031709.1 DUF2358 domain-containing protein [Oscillatoria sp. PMC 1051.18]
MDILQILKEDYQRFPDNQTYSIYAKNVYFQDPLNKFRGVKRYQKMIQFLGTFFQDVKMDLHNIYREGDTIHTEWTLNMTSPLPWKPRLAIPGRSELKVKNESTVISHLDFWHISRFDVLKQNFFASKMRKDTK